MTQRIILAFYFFFGIHLIVNGQLLTKKQNLYVETNYHYGFVTPHYYYMSYFINQHVNGFQLNIGIKTSGNSNWHKTYNYPVIGIGYHRSTLGNSNIYGNMNAVYGFSNRMFFNSDSKFNVGNRMSIGMCHVDKKFKLYTNPFNMSVSSNLNVYINYSLFFDAKIFDKVHAKLGFGVTHISNGNLKKPNIGINYLTAFAGVNYSLSEVKNDNISSVQTAGNSKYQIVISGNFGRKQISRFYTNSYTVYALSIDWHRKILPTGWIGLSWVNYYDTSLKKELISENPSYAIQSADYVRSSLHLSYEIKMGNLSYLIQPGVYLKNAYKKAGDVSNRVGLRYYFKNNITANILIKAHWKAVADFIEWGAGYRF